MDDSVKASTDKLEEFSVSFPLIFTSKVFQASRPGIHGSEKDHW